MRGVATAVVAVLFAAASYALVRVRRSSSLSRAQLAVGAVVCLVLFIAVNLSDWPGTVLATFWAQHPIFAATASTLPLLGVGFFAFEAHEARVRKERADDQEELDRKVASTGRSGLVDHLVDVDVALALLAWDQADVRSRWPGYDGSGRPLRWLREGRHRLGRGPDGLALPTDPRSSGTPYEIAPDSWREALVDQAVRRIMAGIKEWGPLLTPSEDGTKDLIDVGSVRIELIAVAGDLTDNRSRGLPAQIAAVQAHCRRLAWDFEAKSGVFASRQEVLDPEKVPS